MDNSSPKRILLVDDSVTDRETYRRYLSSEPEVRYECLEAETLEEGLEVWESEHPDAVLLDVNLPDGDGLEFLEEVAAEGGGDQPVIVLTGQGDERTAVRAMQLGAADYLVKQDITRLSLQIAVGQLCDRTALLRRWQQSQDIENVCTQIGLQVRQSLNVQEVLNTTVEAVRDLLEVDRCLIYRFTPDCRQGKMVAESVIPPWISSLEEEVEDVCFAEDLGGEYGRGRVFAASDIYSAGLSPCHLALLERFQVRANLVVPILMALPEVSTLWGLLIVHQCSSTRSWHREEIELLQRLAVQVAIAIQQAGLYQRSQELTQTLEQKVQERTQELETLVRQQQLLAHMATQIRSSLNVQSILQTTTEQVRETLGCDRVIIYQLNPDLSGHVVAESLYRGRSLLNTEVHDPCINEEWLEPYRQGRMRVIDDIHESAMSLCHQEMLLNFDIRAKLMAPIVLEPQNQESLMTGVQSPTLWGLMIASIAESPRPWQRGEMELLRQISIQVAIAIQQAMAYEQAKTELARRQETEEELRQSQRFLQRIADTSPNVIYIYDLVRNCNIYVSAAAYLLLGYSGSSPPDLEQHNFLELMHPEDQERAALHFRELQKAADGQVLSFEYRMRHASGSWCWFSSQDTVFDRDEYGQTQIMGVAQEVSDRKQMEAQMQRLTEELERRVQQRTETLQEREAQLRLISEKLSLAIKSADIGIWDWDLVVDELIWDDRMIELYDIDPGEFTSIYQGWLQRVHPEDRPLADAAINASLRGEKDYNIEFRIILSDGSIRHIKANALVKRDSQGRALRMIGINTDISDRKQAEEDLRNRESHLRSAQRIASMGSWEYEIETGKITWSAETFRIFGRSSDQESLTLAKVASFIHPEDRLMHQQTLAEAIATATPYDIELRILRPDGTLAYTVARGEPVLNDQGQMTHLVGTIQDQTERKKAEQQLQQAKEAAEYANRAKSEFLALMSHEIRTPLNGIIGLAYLMAKTELKPLQQDYIQKIQSAGQSLLQIINDILDFSKIEAGKMELESAPFSLSTLLSNLSNILAIKAVEKGIELIFRIDDNCPNSLVGDSLRLSQVLINFTNNAIKFTDRGSVIVAVDTLEGPPETITLRFSVRDTGIGMSTEQVDSLFQPFTQADASTSRKYSGTGLGLSICQRLVHLMGSHIEVETALGEGSCFSFTLEFPQAEESAALDSSSLTPLLSGIRTLVIDDNPHVRLLLTEILESFSLEVVAVSSGAAGLEEIERCKDSSPFELVLVDWCMPEMDGIKTSRNIRQILGTDRPIPHILMVTAYHQPEITQVAQEAGIDVILPKPIDRSRLLETLLQVLGYTPYKMKSLSRAQEVGDLRSLSIAHILLVEDNEINQLIGQQLCQGFGLRVDLAQNGLEALEKIETTAYDLILMDIQMPQMDGLEATRRIRSLARLGEPETERFATVPIIAMTAHALNTDKQKSIDAGMNDHLSKPVNPQELLAVLLKWIAPGSSFSPNPDRLESPPEGGLDVLPGLNVQMGLVRVNGSSVLYRHLLQRFITHHEQSCTKIVQAIHGRQFSEAFYLLHTLKGAAGNLGAEAVYQVAQELETIIYETGNSEETIINAQILADLMLRLEDSLEEALGSITEFLGVGDRQEAVIPGDSLVIDREKTRSLIAEIQSLMEEDLGEAMARLELLKQEVKGNPIESQLQVIEERLMDFDTDSASNLLYTIETTLTNSPNDPE
jgi:PAS domain S-box-containing protein